ncbi:hypothetical protein VNI00_017992 [Paramarasmius palmivorus]|uniref:Uncharacterized protein n=1 Tax=Paramarasmius palmivorus TaxID=297713 RepID=A0AAW0B144_9AGAR
MTAIDRLGPFINTHSRRHGGGHRLEIYTHWGWSRTYRWRSSKYYGSTCGRLLPGLFPSPLEPCSVLRLSNRSIPISDHFLKKCYSVSECQSRAMATPAVPRTEEMEDPSGAIVRDTIEDQGSRGTSSSASGTNVANVASSKPIPSTSKTIPSASNSTSTSSLPKQASLPLKPICPPPINSTTTASSSRSKPYARIMAPAAAPRLPPQGSATMSAVAKGKDTESRPSNASAKTVQLVQSQLLEVHLHLPSPSVAPPSLPPPSPISIRSSPEPEPPIRGSGVADSLLTFLLHRLLPLHAHTRTERELQPLECHLKGCTF